MAASSYWPLWQLTISRMRVFYREPAAVFWVYGFPLVMALSLGTAFRENPKEQIRVDIVEEHDEPRPENNLFQKLGSSDRIPANQSYEFLNSNPTFKVVHSPTENWQKRLQSGKTDLVIQHHSDGSVEYWDEPHRAESRLAKHAVEAAILRHNTNASETSVKHLEQAGSRYIDFLLPGLIGLNLMGGGMWGVGFVIVDMRVRKLLKRFLATPMRKSDFLLAVMCSRLFFTLTDILILLIFGYLVFGVSSRGNYAELAITVLFGGAMFAGIGLLVAARVQTIESVSGVMNFVMLPMWILSGVFFSSERFPEWIQPLINALPLTALNQALRGVMLEGQSLFALWPQAAIMAAYCVLTFTIALWTFRWR
jgi:ABC-2 type transport system permease protein